MRFSNYFIPTYKEIPSEAEVVSHQLLLRAGMIRKLTSGIYSYLPAGFKAIRKVEQIVREEMNRAGAVEVLLPAVQPAELWYESGRWHHYGPELLRFKDRHQREACLGPTHEEVITDLVRNEIRSYRQLPLNLYQIQTKFRDEIRPRFGLMRAREFIMKDAYSFDADEESANRSYEAMYDTYTRIFRRCGLTFRAVEAETGTIGGSFSHEFMVLAETGEDEIVHCPNCGYAANLERAEVAPESSSRAAESTGPPMEEVETPGVRTVEELTAFLGISPSELVKTLVYAADGQALSVLVRGDHEINEAKLKNLLDVDSLELADPALVEETTGAPMGYAGPVNLETRIIADHSVKGMNEMVTGGNRSDLHLRNVRLGRDFEVDRFADLRMITPSDPCPRCGEDLRFQRGIEVGHIFKLGTKYSRSLGARFLDEQGKENPFVMGCYGIGIGRVLAAAIEQNHDPNGIIFPIPISPFEVIILPLQVHQSEVLETAEGLYHGLLDRGIDVLIDDRDERAGVKFNDADLLGVPVRITVGSKGVKNGQVELKLRAESESLDLPVGEALNRVLEKVNELYDSVE